MEAEHAPPRFPNVNTPPGYRFKPTPRELIQCYLEPWVGTEPGAGHQQSPGEFYSIMTAADVYGEEPGALASRFRHIAHDDGNWYFLSVTRWKDGNANSRRMNRAVGGAGDLALGTWHGSGKRIPVRGAGYRQTFEFRPVGGGKATWLMEEFGTARSDATGHDGVRVLCRLHLRPKAAAVAADGEDERQQQQQQQVEVNDAPAPCNKRQRQSAPVEHHFDADYWTAAPPNVGFSAPAPPDVGCSYAPVTESTAEALATWQHQPMMEQAGDDERQQQQQVEVNDVPAPCNKRQRQRDDTVAARQQVEHHFDADYWTAAPDGGFSNSYATTAAPASAHPDVGCSYATTSSQQAAAAAATVTELTAEALATWQHQPMMEQAGDGGYQYHCAGGVYIRTDDEPRPSEMVAADMEFTAQDFKLEDSDYMGVYIRTDDEPRPSEMVAADMEFTAQDFKLEDSDYMFTVEHLLQLADG